MTGTHRRRLFVGGIGLLILVNYLDLVGVLRWSLTSQQVISVSMVWLGLWVVLSDNDRADVAAVTSPLGWLTILGWWASLATGVVYPTAGSHYRLYATPLGMAAQSLFYAAVMPLLMLVLVQLLWWLQDYWHLRRTTPEERVLGPEYRHATDNTEPTQ